MLTLSIDQIKLETRLMLHELRTIAVCCEKSKQSLSPKEVIEWNETRSDGDSIGSDDPTVEEKARFAKDESMDELGRISEACSKRQMEWSPKAIGRWMKQSNEEMADQ